MRLKAVRVRRERPVIRFAPGDKVRVIQPEPPVWTVKRVDKRVGVYEVVDSDGNETTLDWQEVVPAK